MPENAPIKLDSDPACVREHPDGLKLDTILVNNGGLENVFVYVKDGLGNYYFDTPTTAGHARSEGLPLYAARVRRARGSAARDRQQRPDAAQRATRWRKVNQEFNFGQAIQGMKNTKVFTAPEVMVRIKCDVHGWMNAYAGVLDHPYFAVTANGGAFELKNLPAGTYTIEAWHEKLGTADAKCHARGERNQRRQLHVQGQRPRDLASPLHQARRLLRPSCSSPPAAW